MNLSDKTVTKAFKQLADANLIYEKKQGFSKPKLIYVAKIQHLNIENAHSRKNYDYITGNSTITESENLRVINTNNNYTYKNNKGSKKSNNIHLNFLTAYMLMYNYPSKCKSRYTFAK